MSAFQHIKMMLVTTKWMKEKYDYYNNLLWNGALPSIVFKTNAATETWGFATYRYSYMNNTVTPVSITMSNKFDSPENVKLSTLIHEMIHIADYTFNPRHFIRNGQPVSAREYDVHGPIYFLPEMRRINSMLKSEGIVIGPKVQAAEIAQSSLNAKDKERASKRIEHGVHVLVSKLSHYNKHGEYGYSIVKDEKMPEWLSYISTSQWWKNEYEFTDDYLSTDEVFALKRSGKLGNGYYMCLPLESFIEKHGLKLNKRIYDKNNPTPQSGSTETHLIPLFRFKTMSGALVELQNTTKDEIFNTLKEKFPNMSDEVIQKIINHKEFYPMGENSFHISDDTLRQIVREAIEQVTSETSSQIPGQRISKPKQVSKYEYEISIE